MYRLNYPNDPGMHNARWSRHKHRTAGFNDSQTFWEEIKSNWFKTCLLVILLFLTIGFQFYNERKALQISLAVEESLRSVLKLSTTEVSFDENNNKLVYLIGRLNTDTELKAPEYGILLKAAKLRRRYQMLQWVEAVTVEELEEDEHAKPVTTYSYYKAWLGHPVNSDLFNSPDEYSNPKEIPKNEIETSAAVKIGNFILSQGLVDRINHFKPFTGHIRPQSSNIKLHAGLYYHTEDIWNPQVGDIRVEFARAGLADDDQGEIVTIIAKQEGRLLSPYITETGDEILLMHFGHKAPQDMIHLELSQRRWITWIIRVVNWLMLLFLISRLTKLSYSLVHLPFMLRDLLHLGTTSVNLSFTMTSYTLVLAFTYMLSRPLLSLLFLVVSALSFSAICIKLYKADNQENVRHRQA